MAVVMLMPEDNEEDWMKYASAGFGQTDYSLWDDETEEAEVEEEPVVSRFKFFLVFTGKLIFAR